jgi:hypothetical protein
MKIRILMNDDSAKVITCSVFQIREAEKSLEILYDKDAIGYNIKDVCMVTIKEK